MIPVDTGDLSQSATKELLKHKPNSTAEELAAELVNRTLCERLRFAMKEYGLTPPPVLAVGELLQLPGVIRNDYRMGWCILSKYRALFGDFDNGVVIEVNVNGVRKFKDGGAI